MSGAECPYDNAPMERHFNFNTLKNECTNLYDFRTEEQPYQMVEEFAYATPTTMRVLIPTMGIKHPLKYGVHRGHPGLFQDSAIAFFYLAAF